MDAIYRTATELAGHAAALPWSAYANGSHDDGDNDQDRDRHAG